MPECSNPLWPCAMTGAAACLAGFEGITVVIHGSSGCYYYPSTLLHAPLQGTFIMENEVVFGSEERLHEVIGALAESGKRIAVVTTCVPAILGEDIRSMLSAHDVIFVDSPGFSGDIETGYKKALFTLSPEVDPEADGVNIDGVCLFDTFSRGNVQEIIRLLIKASLHVRTVLCADHLDNVWHAAWYTLGTNEDFCSSAGERLGGTLGFEALAETFRNIGAIFDQADIAPLCSELEQQEERVIQACDKYLRRYDPPGVAIFGGFSYATFAARTLERYLDAEILCIGSRNEPPLSLFPVEQVSGLKRVRALITQHDPELVIGSSFEQSVSDDRAFVGLIPPLKGRVRLSPHPIAGIGGILFFVEEVLNACMDQKT